jgi:hypothetical protein
MSSTTSRAISKVRGTIFSQFRFFDSWGKAVREPASEGIPAVCDSLMSCLKLSHVPTPNARVMQINTISPMLTYLELLMLPTTSPNAFETSVLWQSMSSNIMAVGM